MESNSELIAMLGIITFCVVVSIVGYATLFDPKRPRNRKKK